MYVTVHGFQGIHFNNFHITVQKKICDDWKLYGMCLYVLIVFLLMTKCDIYAFEFV